jgi:phage baseplate assembly protein W
MVYKTLVITNQDSIFQQATKQDQFYKGFSTVDIANEGNNLFDIELIKQDIINHFNTRRGERVMKPEFGSIIWDLIMEPLTDDTTDLLKNDIKTICTADPRVIPTQMDLTEYQEGYLLELTLQVVGTDQSANMQISFNRTTGISVQ